MTSTSRTRGEITDRTPPEKLDALETLAESIEADWRCNATAVAAGRLDQSVPSRQMIDAFARRDDALVVEVTDGPVAHGFGIFVATRGPRGGAQIRWLVVPSGPDFAATVRDIAAAGTERFGHVWGRVANKAVHAAILDADPTYRAAGDDPEVLTNEEQRGG